MEQREIGTVIQPVACCENGERFVKNGPRDSTLMSSEPEFNEYVTISRSEAIQLIVAVENLLIDDLAEYCSMCSP